MFSYPVVVSSVLASPKLGAGGRLDLFGAQRRHYSKSVH
jgi:hypothetical protein